eukprot:SAG31_NODE_564_length_14059_cov_5.728940_15_plen_42_part_00
MLRKFSTTIEAQDPSIVWNCCGLAAAIFGLWSDDSCAMYMY